MNKLDKKLNRLATDYFGCDVECGGCSKFVSKFKKIIYKELDKEVRGWLLNMPEPEHRPIRKVIKDLLETNQSK